MTKTMAQEIADLHGRFEMGRLPDGRGALARIDLPLA